MIRELDPYFKFHDKVAPDLLNINAGREHRIKIQDQKIRLVKQQLRDKKNYMAQQLRLKCLDLAELEKMNKRQKTKMLGTTSTLHARNKDEEEVDGVKKAEEDAK